MHMEVAQLQLFIGQPRILSPEHQSHLIQPALIGHLLCSLDGRHERPGNASHTGTGTNDQTTVLHGLFQGCHNRRTFENVHRSDSAT